MFSKSSRDAILSAFSLATQMASDSSLRDRFCNSPDEVLGCWGVSTKEGIFDPPVSLNNSMLTHLSHDYTSYLDRLVVTPNSIDRKCVSPPQDTETILFHLGIKSALRICVPETQLSGVINFCANSNAVFFVAPYKIEQLMDVGKGGYSNRFGRFMPLDASEEGDLIVYIAREVETAVLLWLSETLGLHGSVGRLLGYPECCIEFYGRNVHLTNANFQGDFILLSLAETLPAPPYPFYTNNLLRYFDMFLISHFPCSYWCRQSCFLARSNLRHLKRCDAQRAAILRSRLLSSVLYTDCEGVFSFADAEYIEDESFLYRSEHVLGTTAHSRLSMALKESNRVVCTPTRLAVYNHNTLTYAMDHGAHLLRFGDVFPRLHD